jgi:hypothetical protein
VTLIEDKKRAQDRWRDAKQELEDLRDRLERLDRKIDSKPGADELEQLRREKREKLTQRKKVLLEMVERRDRVRDELVKRLEQRRERDEEINTSPGIPSWGGSRDVADRFVLPVFEKHGIPVTSTKRTETYGNPTSDHHVSQLLAYAVDGGIAEAHGVADEIGEELGVGTVTDYATENFTVDGVRFRVQIIAATHGTGPHLHVGIRRV